MYLAKKEFTNTLGFLKRADYHTVSCTVSDTGIKADAEGKKYVVGGTLLDADGSPVKITRSGSAGSYTYVLSSDPAGILFRATDVTYGSQPGALMYEGAVQTERLPGDYIVEALPQIMEKLPHIRFFVEDALQN